MRSLRTAAAAVGFVLLGLTAGISLVVCVVTLLTAYEFGLALYRRRFDPVTFEGKTVWVTGASSGIGRALAVRLSAFGARLIVSARNEAQLTKLKQQLSPSEVMVVPMDMTDLSTLQIKTHKVLEDLATKGLKLDIVIQNAGASMRSFFKDFSLENHRYLMDLNVNGVFAHLQAIVPYFLEKGEGQVVAVSSVAGKIGVGARTSYSASKHALGGMMDALRAELSTSNIEVTVINPGYIKTPLAGNALSGKPGERFGKTDSNIEGGMDVDLFALEAAESIYYQQREVTICKWLHRLPLLLRSVWPDLVFQMMAYNCVSSQSKILAQP